MLDPSLLAMFAPLPPNHQSVSISSLSTKDTDPLWETLSTSDTMLSTADSATDSMASEEWDRILMRPRRSFIRDIRLAYGEALERRLAMPVSTQIITGDNHQPSPTSRLPYQGYDERYEGMHVAGSPLPEYAPASASPNDAASTGSSLGSEAMDHAINHALLANWRQETQRWAFQWEDFTEPDESDEMDSPAVVATPLDVQMAIPQDTPEPPELRGLEDEISRSLMNEIIDTAMAEWSTKTSTRSTSIASKTSGD
ncbi:uncharacterized protein B0H18DRAFT_1208374 [Fomitopsis serialis]|uniref:uncharacterized protein n=1 Tax=Fomitopsis serialis TaxID=139415 RepID=UPI0020082718|nr:uncharacterized protein B0H18DRAFT_1208374 [Neoantrodia serialis]KAH9932448.1 hypothetical protein B0H18DRAFT_1208374 [Neoantrodia serialis]